MLSIEQIQTIVAIYEQAGIHKAAESLRKTQPNLTITLRRAEESLGFQVFERGEYRLRLTPEGQRLMPQLQEVLNGMKSLQRTVDFLTHQGLPELRLGCDPYCNLELLYTALRGLLSKPVRPLVHFTEVQLEQAYQGVVKGEIDLGIGVQPSLVEPEVETKCIATLEMIGVIRAGLSMKEVPQVKIEGRELKQSKYSDGVMWVSNHSQKMQMIKWGFAWGTLPSYSIDQDQSLAKLEKVPSAMLALYAIRMRKHANSNFLDSIWNQLIEVMS